MQLAFTILLLLFSFQLSFSQDHPDGPFKDYYDSGELKVEGQYKNEKQIGNWKSYHKNGQISSEYSYDDGMRDKEYISYYKDGSVKRKVEKSGDFYVRRSYYESGNLKTQSLIENGYYKEYLENGALIIEANYKTNELDGEWKRYYENGNIEWVVTYTDGYRSGGYKHFFENGNLKLEGENKFDKKNGEEKRYDENNNLEWKGYYSNNKFAKSWVKYNTKGKKIEKVKVKNDSTVLNLDKIKVPDGVIEKVPVFPGCGIVYGNRARKACMSSAVSKFIAKKFNTDIAADLDLIGRQRIIVVFKIDKIGDVTQIKAKAPHPALNEEAIRIISLLPRVIPGYQKQKPVIIPFSIPIVFQVVE
jgi:antitoxin component YwqK of YwqJK toxin-antitoxin module